MADRYPIVREQGKRICLEHVPGVPRYDTFQTSTIATHIDLPYAVAIDEATNKIFVTTRQVGIFTETGEYICQLGEGELDEPYSIAIHRDNVYVKDTRQKTVCRFSLTDMSLVVRMQLYFAIKNVQMTCAGDDPIGRVFMSDYRNKSICVFDANLTYIYSINNRYISERFRVSRDRLYILCHRNNPCMHILTLEGEKLHSIILREEGMDVIDPLFFCLDPLYNIVLSEYWGDLVRVFSPEGNLIHKIKRDGYKPDFDYPSAVAVTPNGRLVCVSGNRRKSGLLQIFC